MAGIPGTQDRIEFRGHDTYLLPAASAHHVVEQMRHPARAFGDAGAVQVDVLGPEMVEEANALSQQHGDDVDDDCAQADPPARRPARQAAV